MPQCNLVRAIQLEAGYPPSVGKIVGSASLTTRDHTFPLLSDAGSATIKRYGILYTVAEEARGPNRDGPVVKSDIQKDVSPSRRTQRPQCLAIGRFSSVYVRFWVIIEDVSVAHPNASMVGMAFPGTFLLDRQGRVRSRFFEAFSRERNTSASLFSC
jgi:peroxiredoxin